MCQFQKNITLPKTLPGRRWRLLTMNVSPGMVRFQVDNDPRVYKLTVIMQPLYNSLSHYNISVNIEVMFFEMFFSEKFANKIKHSS